MVWEVSRCRWQDHYLQSAKVTPMSGLVGHCVAATAARPQSWFVKTTLIVCLLTHVVSLPLFLFIPLFPPLFYSLFYPPTMFFLHIFYVIISSVSMTLSKQMAWLPAYASMLSSYWLPHRFLGGFGVVPLRVDISGGQEAVPSTVSAPKHLTNGEGHISPYDDNNNNNNSFYL